MWGAFWLSQRWGSPGTSRQWHAGSKEGPHVPQADVHVGEHPGYETIGSLHGRDIFQGHNYCVNPETTRMSPKVVPYEDITPLMVKCARGTVLRTRGHVPHGKARSEPTWGVVTHSWANQNATSWYIPPVSHSRYITLRNWTI